MTSLVIEYSAATQSLGALREAAYRLIGHGSCQIETVGDVHRCLIEPAPRRHRPDDELRSMFIDLVTDENLREKLATETAATRHLILALAFGALASKDDASSSA